MKKTEPSETETDSVDQCNVRERLDNNSIIARLFQFTIEQFGVIYRRKYSVNFSLVVFIPL